MHRYVGAARPALAIVASLAISGCGGSGTGFTWAGGGTSPQTAADTFPLKKTGTFDTISATRSYDSGSGSPVIESHDVSRAGGTTISYDAATDTYKVTGGASSATFGASSRTSTGAFDKYATGSGELTLFSNVRAGSAQTTAVRLSYLSYGDWARRDTATGKAADTYMLFGYPTADMPKSGTATYKTQVSASYLPGTAGAVARNDVTGTATFSADFARGTFGTTLALNAPGSTSLGNYESSGAITGAQFGGALTSSDPGFGTGRIEGGFFGPGATEMGYAFDIQRNGTGGSIVGAVVGKKN